MNYNTKREKKHIFFLVLSFLICNQFFNFYILDIHIWRAINWGYTILLFLYVIFCYLKGGFLRKWLRQWSFILVFLGIVTLSFFYVSLTTNQTIDETFRVCFSWYQYLLLFVLAYKKFSPKELFIALMVFSVIWFGAMIAGFLSPIPLYDASGEFDPQQLMTTHRGIVRLKVSGSDLMNLWGFWCLGIYVVNKQRKYLYAYLICLIFVFLMVSRQHIVFYSLVGFLYLFQRISFLKKTVLVTAILVLFYVILPQVEIWQDLTALTESQMQDNNGGKDDIRIQAATFYLTEFPQNIYTIFLGHGQFHSHSNYGHTMFSIMDGSGFILADIGFVGIYIYYGVLGLFCFLLLLINICKKKIPKDLYGLKLYVFFTYFTTIFSHNIDTSMIGTSICIYLVYLYSSKPTSIMNKKCSEYGNSVYK